MKILILDPKGIASADVRFSARERILYGLVRFGARVRGVTVRFLKDDSGNSVMYGCEVHVTVHGNRRIQRVSSRRFARDLDRAIGYASMEIEPRVQAATQKHWMSPFSWMMPWARWFTKAA